MTESHIHSFLNSPSHKYLDISISGGLDLYDENHSVRTILLNSTSFALLSTINGLEISISNSNLKQTLKSWGLPPLKTLIKTLSSIHRLKLPGYLVGFTETPALHGSICSAGYKKMFTKSFTEPSIYCHPLKLNANDSIKHESSNSSAFLKLINKRLNECKYGIKRPKLEEHLFEDKSVYETRSSLSTLEELLFYWIIELIHDQKLSIGTVKDYFNRIYSEVFEVFCDEDLFDIEIDRFVNELYPNVFKKLGEKECNSELKRFHNFIAEIIGVSKLHFTTDGVSHLASPQRITFPHEVEALKYAIDSDPVNQNKLVVDSLKLETIILASFGLRASEPVEILQSHLLTSDNALLIKGRSSKRKKTRAGNRTIHTQGLIPENDLKHLSELLKQTSTPKNNLRLLFPHIEDGSKSNKVLKDQSTKYLTTLLRGITGSNVLNIKSFRKSFASLVLMRIAMLDYEKIPRLLKSIKPELITENMDYQLGHKTKHKRLWLLADWIGHESPQTTMVSYASALEFNLFLKTESLLEESMPSHLYSKLLKYIGSDKINSAQLKNLNRYKGLKYIQLFSAHITENCIEASKTDNTLEHIQVADQEMDLKTLSEIVSLYASGVAENQIDKQLLLSPGTTILVLQKTYHGIQNLAGSPISNGDEYFKNLVVQLFNLKKHGEIFKTSRIEESEIRWFKHAQNKINTLRNNEPFFALKEIWEKNTKSFARGFICTSHDELQSFFNFIEILFDHNLTISQQYIINVNGIKHNNDSDPLELHSYLKYLIQDNRKISLTTLPHEEYEIVLSTRRSTANRPKNLHHIFHLLFVFYNKS